MLVTYADGWPPKGTFATATKSALTAQCLEPSAQSCSSRWQRRCVPCPWPAQFDQSRQSIAASPCRSHTWPTSFSGARRDPGRYWPAAGSTRFGLGSRADPGGTEGKTGQNIIRSGPTEPSWTLQCRSMCTGATSAETEWSVSSG